MNGSGGSRGGARAPPYFYAKEKPLPPRKIIFEAGFPYYLRAYISAPLPFPLLSADLNPSMSATLRIRAVTIQ